MTSQSLGAEPQPPAEDADAGGGGIRSPGKRAPIGYRDLGAEIGALVEKKQAAYGDSFGKSGQVMRLLYPDGIPPEKLDDALAIVRVVDKLFRIATDRDALGESPWRDVAGYGLLGAERVERQRWNDRDRLAMLDEIR